MCFRRSILPLCSALQVEQFVLGSLGLNSGFPKRTQPRRCSIDMKKPEMNKHRKNTKTTTGGVEFFGGVRCEFQGKYLSCPQQRYAKVLSEMGLELGLKLV